jgi:hypothetical protein
VQLHEDEKRATAEFRGHPGWRVHPRASADGGDVAKQPRLPQIAKIFRIPVGALFDANADTSAGESTGAAPVKLIPDRNTLKLLTAFGDITDSGVRHSLVNLVDKIAKARKTSR